MKNEGYLHIDHRASPGLPEVVSIKLGLDPALCKEGKVFEAATKRCKHCPNVVILNPERIRKRGHCFKCSGFICDSCVAKTQETGYVHVPFAQIVDLVKDAEAKNVPILGSPMKLLGL